MSVDRDGVDLGPWRDSDLAETVSRYAGEGSDDDLDTFGRFMRGVCQLGVRQSGHGTHGARPESIAIFLLHPAAPHGCSAAREPLLGDGGIEVSGRIWLVNATVQSGHAVVPPGADDDSMFEHVDSLGLSGVPAVVLNPKVFPQVVRFYRKGLGDENCIETIKLEDRRIDLCTIREIIDRMHEGQLVTPDAQVSGASMWARASDFRAASNAEAIAQLQMKTALAARLFNCVVRHEQTMRGGRSDIEIVQVLGDGTTITTAEIEVKVLRERTRRGRQWSEKQNEWWMRRGVGQAAAYREDRQAKWGVLWCFDMRTQDRGEAATFAGVKCHAGNLEVALERNFLYNSAGAWRQARYGS